MTQKYKHNQMQVAVDNNRNVFGRNLRLEAEVRDAIMFIALTIFQPEIRQGKRIGIQIHKKFKGQQKITTCGFAVIMPFDRRVKIRCSVKVPSHKGMLALIATVIIVDTSEEAIPGYGISKRITDFNESGVRIDTQNRRVFTLPSTAKEALELVSASTKPYEQPDSSDQAHANEACLERAAEALYALWERPTSRNPNGNWKWPTVTRSGVMEMISAEIVECGNQECADLFAKLLELGYIDKAPGRQGAEKRYILPLMKRRQIAHVHEMNSASAWEHKPAPKPFHTTTASPQAEVVAPHRHSAHRDTTAEVVEQLRLHVRLSKAQSELRAIVSGLQGQLHYADSLLTDVDQMLRDLPSMEELVERL